MSKESRRKTSVVAGKLQASIQDIKALPQSRRVAMESQDVSTRKGSTVSK